MAHCLRRPSRRTPKLTPAPGTYTPTDTKLVEMPVPISVSLDIPKTARKSKSAGSEHPLQVRCIPRPSDSVGMIHECAISKNWIIFILLPLCVSLDRLKQGGKHFMWDDDLPMCLGLLPRNNPKTED